MAVDRVVLPHPRPALVPRVLVSAPERLDASLVEGLRDEGLALLVAPAGTLAAVLAQGGVDVVLLQGDRSSVLGELLQLRRTSPVPVVVALRELRGPVDGLLEAGADDCVLAGAPRAELAARVRTLARRVVSRVEPEVLVVGPFVVDTGRRSVLREGRPLHLAPKEFGLLELLMRRDGRVVSRDELLARVWGERASGDRKTVDVHVMRVRGKVEPDPTRPVHLLTVRGLGYRFTA